MGQVLFKPAATLAVAVLLLVAGCGDDEEPTPITPVDSGATGATGAGPITPEELIDEGDPICAEAYTALTSAPANVTGAQQASIVEGLTESLQSLGDPGTENEDDLDDFYDSLEDAQKAYDDEDTLSAEAALADARAAADRYGFKDCGEEGQALDGADSSDTSTDDSTSTPSTEPAPTEPVTPAPAPEPSTPPAGGTDTDTPSDGGGTGSDSGTDSGGTDGSGSGGVSP